MGSIEAVHKRALQVHATITAEEYSTGNDTITLENIQNHFHKVRHYMYAYLEGLKPGAELDEAIKKYKIASKSHRRIGLNG